MASPRSGPVTTAAVDSRSADAEPMPDANRGAVCGWGGCVFLAGRAGPGGGSPGGGGRRPGGEAGRRRTAVPGCPHRTADTPFPLLVSEDFVTWRAAGAALVP